MKKSWRSDFNLNWNFEPFIQFKGKGTLLTILKAAKMNNFGWFFIYWLPLTIDFLAVDSSGLLSLWCFIRWQSNFIQIRSGVFIFIGVADLRNWSFGFFQISHGKTLLLAQNLQFWGWCRMLWKSFLGTSPQMPIMQSVWLELRQCQCD